MTLPLSAIFSGLTLGFSLILAIGAQNAFILRCGVRNDHPFFVASVCTVADCILISTGVFGVGQMISETAWLRISLGLAGTLFLLFYGASSLWAAYRGTGTLQLIQTQGEDDSSEANVMQSFQRTPIPKLLIVTLGFSLLNPHAILDTVVLIGGVAAQFPDDVHRAGFALGTILASTVFFYSLAYGARRLASILSKPISMRILDGLVGLLMLMLALNLAMSLT